MELKNCREVPVSIPCPEDSVRTQWNFLKNVARFPRLFSDTTNLDQAIYRYEKLWMPLLGSQPTDIYTTPPLDVHWVWYCHMMSPELYRKDSMTLAGRIVDHRVIECDEVQARKLWRSAYRKDQFNPPDPLETANVCKYEPISECHLKFECVRHGRHIYNVSLTHYSHHAFLKSAVRRYKQMLLFRKLHDSKKLIPCFDMDLVWRTHMLHPDIYCKDTELYFGSLLAYDTEAGEEQVADEVHDLWNELFQEQLIKTGCMWRGPMPNDRLFPFTEEEQNSLQVRHVSINFARMTVSKVRSRNTKVRLYLGRTEIDKVASAVDQDKEAVFEAPGGPYFMSTEFVTLMNHEVTAELVANENVFCFSRGDTEACISYEPEEDIKAMMKAGKKKRPFALSDRFDESEMVIRGDIIFERFGVMALSTTVRCFEHKEMPENLMDLWGTTPLPPMPKGVPRKCLTVTHDVNAAGVPEKVKVKVRITHSLPLMMSAVQVFMNGKMICVSHLIGPEQLIDSKSELAKCTKMPINLATGQRAMLIKTNSGDWGVIHADWVNVKEGSTAHKAQSSRAVPSGAGNLNIKVRSFDKKTDLNIDVGVDDDFSIALMGARCSLKTGQILISYNHEEWPACIAAFFSVCVLSNLVQPLPPNFTQPMNHKGKISKPHYDRATLRQHDPPINVQHSGDLLMLASAGWLMDIPTNEYMAMRKKEDRKLTPVSSPHDGEKVWVEKESLGSSKGSLRDRKSSKGSRQDSGLSSGKTSTV